jgi:hypothetical protein
VAYLEVNFIQLELVGMKLKNPHTVAQIAAMIDATFVGDGAQLILSLIHI